jgi:hypothetical protein
MTGYEGIPVRTTPHHTRISAAIRPLRPVPSPLAEHDTGAYERSRDMVQRFSFWFGCYWSLSTSCFRLRQKTDGVGVFDTPGDDGATL